MAASNLLIAIAVIAAVVGILLWAESKFEKMLNEERIRICSDIVAHADEFEHAEIAITPGHLREIAMDIKSGES